MPADTVSDHLTASRAAHQRYRTLHDASRNTDHLGMRAALQDAFDHRKAAHLADGGHSDPAWQIDVFEGVPTSHADLMQFYRAYLATH